MNSAGHFLLTPLPPRGTPRFSSLACRETHLTSEAAAGLDLGLLTIRQGGPLPNPLVTPAGGQEWGLLLWAPESLGELAGILSWLLPGRARLSVSLSLPGRFVLHGSWPARSSLELPPLPHGGSEVSRRPSSKQVRQQRAGWSCKEEQHCSSPRSAAQLQEAQGPPRMQKDPSTASGGWGAWKDQWEGCRGRGQMDCGCLDASGCPGRWRLLTGHGVARQRVEGQLSAPPPLLLVPFPQKQLESYLNTLLEMSVYRDYHAMVRSPSLSPSAGGRLPGLALVLLSTICSFLTGRVPGREPVLLPSGPWAQRPVSRALVFHPSALGGGLGRRPISKPCIPFLSLQRRHDPEAVRGLPHPGAKLRWASPGLLPLVQEVSPGG